MATHTICQDSVRGDPTTKNSGLVPEADFLTPYVPPQLILIAAIVSIIVGILAGIVPAMRASALDPVEALRYES